MKASWIKYKLKLKQPFVLSYGSFDFRSAFILSIEHDGNIGLGEATAITYYGWSEEKISTELDIVVDLIAHTEDVSQLLSRGDFCSPVQNALSCAFLDLQAKLERKTLRDYLNIARTGKLPLSSITISGSTQSDFEKQITENDWPILKIKMGSAGDEMKLGVIKNHPTSLFRIDANAGWTLDWVQENRMALQLENIECIEQPFPVEQPELNLELKKLVDKPLIADESCRGIKDVSICQQYFDGINVKLMKCGGWHNTMALVKSAREAGQLIMLGCMTETSVGISHAAQLLDAIDLADIDGSYLLENDPAIGTFLAYGHIHLSTGYGAAAKMKNK